MKSGIINLEKNIFFILILSFTMYSCFKSNDIDKKDKKDKKDSELKIELENVKEEFRKKNNVIFNFDSISINYSIEINKYLNKNIYCNNFIINDIYEKDSLFYMSINTQDKYFLELEIKENQLTAIYNSLDKTTVSYLLERLESKNNKRFIVFNLENLYKIKDRDTVILRDFRGKGKLIDYKKVD